MAQGKFKKAKQQPVSIKKKLKGKDAIAFTRRSNAPIQPKKAKFNDCQKIKNAISKTVNKSFEGELRARATAGEITLTKAQQAVAKHHKTMQQAVDTKSVTASTK